MAYVLSVRNGECGQNRYAIMLTEGFSPRQGNDRSKLQPVEEWRESEDYPHGRPAVTVDLHLRLITITAWIG